MSDTTEGDTVRRHGARFEPTGAPMRGGMMDVPLTVPSMITQRAEDVFRSRGLIGTDTARDVQERTWGETVSRARRLAGGLRDLGVGPGDRVATFLSSRLEHVEVYLAAPSMGSVLHTINPNLSADDVAFVVEDADDAVVICEEGLLAAWREVEVLLRRTRRLVVVPDRPGAASPAGLGAVGYEALLADSDPAEWARPDELAAAHLSYTTGTTGRPKGVAFSHRSTVLQAMAAGLAAAEGLTSADTVCPLVPLFLSQVGIPYAAALHGAGMVLPGSDLSPAAIASVVAEHRPTVAIGFGAALTGLLEHWRAECPDLSSLRRLVCGGSAVPRSVSRAFEEEVGVELLPVFGMTETSGHGSFGSLPVEAGPDPSETTRDYYATSQGRPLPLVSMRLADESDVAVPHDGRAIGELQVRGPWVAGEYVGMGRPAENFRPGWLRTGDAARIDELGFVHVVDRLKDLVRRDGEWIPTLELEEQLMAHAAVGDAAVVAVEDAGGGQRPAATVVLTDGSVTADDLLTYLLDRVPKSWLPDSITLVDRLPRTSIGKVDKNRLRADEASVRDNPTSAAADPVERR